MTTIHRRPAPWRGNAVFCASAAFAAGLETLFARLLERRPADSAEALLRQRLHHELEHGSGVLLHDSALLRGLAEDEFQRVFRAFCQWLGRTVAINRNGEYLKEVRDLGLRDARDAPQRGHLTSQELAFHSDRADLTVLACWSPARRGGAFRIRSSADVLATLEAANPAWLPLLGQPIPHDLRDEGDADYALVPLLTETPRTFVLRYIRKFNESVTRHGLSLAPQVRSMLDGLDEAIERADGYAELDFSKGMLVLVNNHTTLHAHRVQRRRAAAPLPAALLAEQRVHPRTAGKLPAAVPPGSRRQPARRHPSPRPGAPPVSDNTFSVQRFRALPTEIHVMLVGTLLTRGAYFMVWPFLALLLWREFRLSASAIGLLLALATVCGALSGIYTGWLSDRFGRKRLIFFGTSLSGLSFVLLGFSGQPLSYGLAISGVSIGCALLESSCKALIGDRVEDRRSRELALYCRYFLINLGAALGPLIGLTLGVAAQAGTFLVTALVYFCYGLLLWRLLHHLELKRRSLAPRSSTGFLEACLSMARHRAFTLLLLCNMLAALIYATFDSTLVQYLTRSGLPDVVNSIALLVTINALTIVVAQFPLLRLLENTGTGGRLMLGMLLMLLAQLGFAWTPVTLFAGLALATVVLSLGELIVFPTFSVEVDQLTPDDLRGSYFGAANLYSLGTALAPLYGGIMLDHAGSQALYLGLAALCGVIMLLQVGAVGLRQAERAGG